MKRLVDALHPGARVFVSTLSTESALLQDELRADPERASGVTFMGVQFPGIDRADYLAVHPEARQTAYFMSPECGSFVSRPWTSAPRMFGLRSAETRIESPALTRLIA